MRKAIIFMILMFLSVFATVYVLPITVKDNPSSTHDISMIDDVDSFRSTVRIMDATNPIINTTTNGYAWNFVFQIPDIENASAIGIVHDMLANNTYHIFVVVKEGSVGELLHVYYYKFNYSSDALSKIDYNFTLVAETITDLSTYVPAVSYGNIVSTRIVSSYALYNGSYIFVIGIQIKTDSTLNNNQVFTILAYKYDLSVLKEQLLNSDILTNTDPRRILFDMIVWNYGEQSFVIYIYQYDERGTLTFQTHLCIYDLVSGSLVEVSRQNIGELLYKYKLSNPVLSADVLRLLMVKINDERGLYQFYEVRYNITAGTVNDPWAEGYKFDSSALGITINELIAVREFLSSTENMTIFYLVKSETEEFIISNIANISDNYAFLTPTEKLDNLKLPMFLHLVNYTKITNETFALYYGNYLGESYLYMLKFINSGLQGVNEVNITISTNVITRFVESYNETESSIAVLYIGYDKNSTKKVYLTIGLLDSDRDGLNDDLEEVYYKTDPKLPDTDSDGLIDGSEILIYDTNASNPDTDNDGLTDIFELKNNYDPLDPDIDGDELKDGEEVNIYKTDPRKVDTDSDGLNDFEEAKVGYDITVEYANGSIIEKHVYTNATNLDSDGDGLSDAKEKALKTNPWSNDTDEDGLDDFSEVLVYKTNPSLWDSDGDSLSDGDEVLIYGIDPLSKDSDGDGLYDLDEIGNHTLPNITDTDNDGLNDYEEIVSYGTNPLANDSDGDGLSDGLEILTYKSNATDVDSDKDGLNDGFEVEHGLNPMSSDTDKDQLPDYVELYDTKTNATNSDSDSDGLTDYEEIKLYHTNATNPDSDGDGLNDAKEIYLKTNATNPDSDGDGLNDYVEITEYGTNPINPDSDGDGLSDSFEIEKSHTDPLLRDSDGDGLSDYDEYNIYHTNPNSKDSDGDGLSDFEEISVLGTNPNLTDSDGDGIPDQVDPNPTFNDLIIVGVALAMLLIGGSVVYAKSTGAFRDWRDDTIIIGFSELGGTPMFALPEEEAHKHDITMISSALYGMWSLTSEISGREQKFLVFGGKPSIIISVGEHTILWAITKRSYKKLEKSLRSLHEKAEKEYKDVILAWQGIEEYLKPLKEYVMREAFPKSMEKIEKVEIGEEEIEEKELEKEIEIEEDVFKELEDEEK